VTGIGIGIEIEIGIETICNIPSTLRKGSFLRNHKVSLDLDDKELGTDLQVEIRIQITTRDIKEEGMTQISREPKVQQMTAE
jgi:hypothetical protein